MANFHLNSVEYLCQLSINKDQDMILEIGSDRDEGSTEFFYGFAFRHEIPFYTVDVVDQARQRFTHLQNINWEISKGSDWTKSVLPTLNRKIKVLYLDNYDWTNPGSERERIVSEYLQRGEHASNLSCQVEHLHQMINCLPYMSNESLVICDDTSMVEHSQTYTGKCAAVIPYLLIHGYKIVYTGNNGVILKNDMLL